MSLSMLSALFLAAATLAPAAERGPALLTPLAPELFSPRHSYVLAQAGESYFSNPGAGIDNVPFLSGVYKAFGFSFDGRYFLYLKSNGKVPTFALYRYEMATAGEERVTADMVHQAVWSPTSLKIAYMAMDSAMQMRLMIHDPAAGTAVTVGQGMIDPDFVEWAPDGNSLLYTVYEALSPALLHDPKMSAAVWRYDLRTRRVAREAAGRAARYSSSGLVAASALGARPRASVPASLAGTNDVVDLAYAGDSLYATFAEGAGRVVKVFDGASGEFRTVAGGEIHRAIETGVVVREFLPSGVRYSYLANGRTAPAATHTFSSSWLLPYQGSAYLVQGGALFSGGACDGSACLVVAHRNTLGYGLDFQQTIEEGQGNKHVLASEDGTVVATYNTVTCNSNAANAATCTSGIDPYSRTCSDPNSGAGNYVVIAHADGSYTFYGHLRSGSVQVSSGQFVARGTYIADQGHSGVAASPTGYNSCGEHLHFQRQVNAAVWAQSVATDFQDAPCLMSCMTAHISQNVETAAAPAPALSLAMVPSRAPAGSTTYGNTVTLPAAAPSGNAVVALSSSNPAVSVPSSVTIAAGAFSASFAAAISGSASPGVATVQASYNGNTASSTLSITSVAAALLTLTQTTIVGGNTTATNEVDLTGVAPAGGAVVTLTSSNPAAAAVPPTLTISSGVTYGFFSITTYAVTAATPVTITASCGGVTLTANLTVTPAALSSITLSPNIIYGGYTSTGTVKFTGTVAADTVVTLASSDPAAVLPASVTVPANGSTVTFPITSTSVPANVYATISASAGGITKGTTLTVKAIQLSSLILYPSSIGGGIPTTINRVQLNYAAVADTTVSLSCPDPSVSIPATVLVAAGATQSNYFTITTSAVTSTTYVTITATYNGSVRTATLTVTPIQVSSLTLNPSTVIGGNRALYNSLRLNSAAPPGGAAVALTSSDPVAQVPATVTVSAGGTLSPNFVIYTSLVTVATPVTITASYGGVSVSQTLTVNPILVSSVSLSPTSVGGGNSTTANRVVLNSAAPTGGAAVTMASSDSSVTVPATVYVSPGSTNSSVFTITTGLVTSVRPVTISATYNGVTQSSVLTVNPIQISAVTLSPANLGGGATSTANSVALNYPAPPGGAVVSLASSDAVVTLPASVTVAAGSSSAAFTIQTAAVASARSVTITASYGGATQTATLTVTPAALATLALSPSAVGGGNSTTANTVTLNGPAPAGGAAVALSSSNPTLATVPAAVTVPAGGTNATFTIATAGVAAVTQVTITASYGGVTQSAVLTLNPPVLSTLVLVPSSVGGGNSSTGNTVTLNAPAPSGGAAVTLSSSNPAVAAVPPTAAVAAGSLSGTFTISTTAVASPVTVTITASFGGVTQTASLTVGPILVTSLVLSPNPVVGSNAVTGTVNLNISAPAGGAVVALASSDAAAVVPASVTVAGGGTSATFSISTMSVAADVTANITATFGSSSRTAALVVKPPIVALLRLSPTSVGGGNTTTGNYVTLTAPAPAGGAVITLTSSDVNAQPPATVTVPPGATMSPNFTITSSVVTSPAYAMITAAFGGTSKSVWLTVNPILPSVLTLYPSSVGGGNSTTVNRVTLNYAAPAGGVTVALASADPAAVVPASVTIPAGATTSPYFTITTSAVAADTSVVISATYGGVTKQATLLVYPIVLTTLTLNPTSVTGGKSTSSNNVRINSAAPPGGAVVTLTSSNPAVAAVPASVTVNAGGTLSPNFTITTSPVASPTVVTITASYGGVTKTADLTVN